VALSRAAIAHVAREVMLDWIAAVGEVAIAGCLILVGRRLIAIGRGLIAVGPGLVSISERLIATSERLFVFERARRRGNAVLLSLERPVREIHVHGTIA
jgi:hypothetical protein